MIVAEDRYRHYPRSSEVCFVLVYLDISALFELCKRSGCGGRPFTSRGCGDPDAIFANTSYDAAFLLALAVEKASGKKEGVAAAVVEVSNGEGDAILPGEWKKAKELIAAGTAIDYKGAAGDHNFDSKGDVPGTYALFEVGSNGFETITEMK